jgi:transcription elongation factor SPT6
MYAFCSMKGYPGHFWLCYQLGADKPKGSWGFKVCPKKYEMRGQPYPDMQSLKNGFKMLAATKAGAALPLRR